MSRHRLTAWELARTEGPVSVEDFGRIACRATGQPLAWEAVKQSAMRWCRWARERGLEAQVVKRTVVFERAALKALLARPPRRSPGSGTTTTEGACMTPTVRNSDDQLLSLKAASVMLEVDVRTLGRWLRTKRPPFPVVRINARVVRVKLKDVRAWVDSKTVGRVSK